MMPVYIYGVLSTKRLLYFTASNPGIEMGGFFGEKKDDILSLINKEYKVKGFRVTRSLAKDQLLVKLQQHYIDFPVVAKPNVGERGFAVKIIDTVDSLVHYPQNQTDFIIQEYVDYPLELGVLYFRYPNEEKGQVTSLSRKRFLWVLGDGKRTVRELMDADPRNRLYVDLVENQFSDKLDLIPQEDERFVVHKIGNHSKGTQFIDETKHLSNQLSETFDKINNKVSGVFYGRYDLKVPSFDKLIAGEEIKIFELNGVSSEPGHMYDQPNAFKSYRLLAEHWLYIIKISKQNIQNGVTTTPILFFIRKVVGHFV